jgi:hypothetical protein
MGLTDTERTEFTALSEATYDALVVEVRAGRAVRKHKVVKSTEPDDLVFQSVQAGESMNDQNVLRRHIRPAGKTPGLHVNWRCLRTSHATWLVQAGADPKSVPGQRKRLIARILTIPFISIACFAVAGIALLLAWRFPMMGRDTFVLVLLLGIPPIVVIGFATLNGAFRYVTLDSKTTASSFWKKNWEHIVMLLIGGIIGSGFTVLVQWLSHWLFGPVRPALNA